jgi:hypothetical protein
MSPELQRAIIKVVPDYFSWDENRQEKYRVDIPENDFFKIQQFLLKELLDISVSNDDEISEALRDMSIPQCTKFNATLLPLKGIGEDYFYLNEHIGEPQNRLSFDTLYDYDFDDFVFQEDSREKGQKGYQRRPYQGSLYFGWARLIIDGAFSYGTLCMVAGYLYGQLDEFGIECIGKLIPHEYVHGKNHRKPEGSGYLFDIKTDAKGLESQLKELEHRFWEYLRDVHVRLMDEFDKKSQQRVFLLDQSKSEDPNQLFLFSDKEILKRIHFKTFMRDCRAVEQMDHSPLFQKLKEEEQLLEKYLNSQYADIMENFDPKIVKFRKKYKVIIHKDAGLDELID